MSKPTLSEQIRAAALGPTPRSAAAWVYGWVGGFNGAQKAVIDLCDMVSFGVSKFTGATETQKRMFLLLCAEALESETA